MGGSDPNLSYHLLPLRMCIGHKLHGQQKNQGPKKLKCVETCECINKFHAIHTMQYYGDEKKQTTDKHKNVKVPQGIPLRESSETADAWLQLHKVFEV